MPRQFTAIDPGGEEIVIFIEHGILDQTFGRQGEKRRFPGLRTEDGRYVNYIRKGEYEIVDEDGNTPISSNDLNAP